MAFLTSGGKGGKGKAVVGLFLAPPKKKDSLNLFFFSLLSRFLLWFLLNLFAGKRFDLGE